MEVYQHHLVTMDCWTSSPEIRLGLGNFIFINFQVRLSARIGITF